MRNIIFLFMISFILFGCTGAIKEPPYKTKFIMKNILDYDIYYEIEASFLISNSEFSLEIREGKIEKTQENEIGYVRDSEVGGFSLNLIKLYSDSNKNNIIYEADLKNAKIVDLALKEEYQDEELKKIANMFISNEGFGLLVDEKLITEFSNK
jgi:hypothetical protein